MDKLDDFLKNRLNDFSPTEDGWNVPSDDLWHSAKEYFPKEEKKSRWFYWLPILLLLFGSLGTGYYFGKMSSEKKNIYQKEIIDSSVKSSNSDLQEKFINDKITSKENTVSNKLNNTSNIIRSDNSVTEIEKNKKTNFLSHDEKIEISNSTKENAIEEIIINRSKTSSKKMGDKSYITNEGKNASKETDMAFPFELAQNANDLDSNIGLGILVKNDKHTYIKNDNNFNSTEFKSLNSKVPTNLEQSMMLDKSIAESVSNFETSINKLNRKIRPNKEYGLSYTGILLQPLSKINFNAVDDEPVNDSLNIDLKYFNTNFHFTKWFAKKWSLSTGLYLSNFDLKIDASINETLGTDDLDYFVSNEFNKTVDIKVVDTQNDFQIQLIEGVQVEESDPLKIDVQAHMLIRSAQIPLLLNYHISKKRMEYIFSAGGSLDFYSADIIDAEVSIYKNGAVINEPISESSLKEQLIFGSIYTQTAFRYKLNQRLNLGLTAKINFINPFISGLEAGLFYRFY